MINIPDICKNLAFRNGKWYSGKTSSVSYPDEGNDFCFQIEDNSFWFKHRNKCIIEMVKNFPPKGEIFDIGGGNGYVSAELERNGFNTYLVEPGRNGVNNAEKRKLKNIICSTLEDAGFKQNSIPAAGLFDVIEHIKEDFEFLKKVQITLVDEGKLYLTLPAYSFLWSAEDSIAGHYQRYNKRTITEILQKNGFKIEYSSYMFFFLPIPIFFFRALPYRLGIRKKEIVPEKLCNEHKPKNKLVNKIIWKLLCLEQGWVSSKKSIPFGGSILITATKG